MGRAYWGAAGDVARIREAGRRRRLFKFAVVVALVADYALARWLGGDPVHWGMPHFSLPQAVQDQLPAFILISVLCLVLVGPMMMMGRSPHTTYRPSEISTTLDDVVGLGMVKDEVIKTLNLFLAYKTFREQMGGNPRRAILFEGPPGTGKTYMAKAMAREAGVPFLFIAASSIQSPYFGQTNRKIANFFKQLRKAARKEGGAIGFIEEIDAIAVARAGMGENPKPRHDDRTVYRTGLGEGFAGVINELLIQLQSFDEPTKREKVTGWGISKVNRLLPARFEIRKRPPVSSNILVIGATNRASALDPALLRPGRFDRSIHFDVPGRAGRREIIDYYLDKKAHVPELDKDERRDQLAALTLGYSPVMIEHLFDEALVWALRDGREAMEWPDLQSAKLTEEIGLANPVEYTEHEKRVIATHEAGHAVVANLVGVGPQARGALDRPPARLARPARALGHRGAVPADALRAARAHPDQLRRHGGGGDLVRRVGDRARWRPEPGDRDRGDDGRRARHVGLARELRGERWRSPRQRPRGAGAGRRRVAPGDREDARPRQGVGARAARCESARGRGAAGRAARARRARGRRDHRASSPRRSPSPTLGDTE